MPTSSAASTPPPIRSDSRQRKVKPWIIVVVIATLAGLISLTGIVAAILIPTVGKVRETARRTVDASNLRQVAQASLIYASDHSVRLPARGISSDGRNMVESSLATIHTVAAELARDGGLNESSLWFPSSDPHGQPTSGTPVVLGDGSLNPEFIEAHTFAWEFVTGLHVGMPLSTPVAWTRGLRRDGTWDARNGVYGDDGGHIVFLGGNVTFFTDLSTTPLTAPDGSPTSDIAKALPPGARVVGAGPGTLHGLEGGSP